MPVERAISLPENRAEFSNQIVVPRLVAIDGPDGVGKGTLARCVADILNQNTREEQEVVLVSPNLFLGTNQAERLGQKFQEAGAYSQHDTRINSFYLAAYNRNARGLIVPAVEQNNWVIVDSSELRPVAFTHAERSEEVAKRTQELMFSGMVNQGLWPRHRILLSSDPLSLLGRIEHRGHNSGDDPSTLEGCDKRAESYEIAAQIFQENLPEINAQTRWHRQTIRTVELNQVNEYMNGVAEEITGWILEA